MYIYISAHGPRQGSLLYSLVETRTSRCLSTTLGLTAGTKSPRAPPSSFSLKLNGKEGGGSWGIARAGYE